MLLFDFSADNQTITQNIPQALNSNIDIRLALQQGSTYHKGCKLVLTPVNGATINGTTTSIELTADGYNGTLKPTTDSGWQFDRVGDNAVLKVNDYETAQLIVEKSSGLEVYNDGANKTGLRIKPAILAKRRRTTSMRNSTARNISTKAVLSTARFGAVRLKRAEVLMFMQNRPQRA